MINRGTGARSRHDRLDAKRTDFKKAKHFISDFALRSFLGALRSSVEPSGPSSFGGALITHERSSASLQAILQGTIISTTSEAEVIGLKRSRDDQERPNDANKSQPEEKRDTGNLPLFQKKTQFPIRSANIQISKNRLTANLLVLKSSSL
ncbi:hypothetical protein L596_027422 [Steinernema carpocapsae]|uniref:Uncharacterized protein n=1 Tax=Steinernema carpocapsae TaxID=34508 RepID=A0A4U5M4I1_STECR|nr:hypothetical protein L596_027422 [Steinernema carpocapsae]